MERKDFIEQVGLSAASILIFGCMQSCSKSDSAAPTTPPSNNNKPTNKVGSKADKELRARTKSVQMSKEQTKAQYDYYYGKGSGDDVTQINKSVTPRNEARSVRTFKPKPKRRGK